MTNAVTSADIPETLEEGASKINSLVGGIVENLVEIGKICKHWADQGKLEELIESTMLPHTVAARCIMIVNGELDKRLAFQKGMAANSLVRCPIHEQKRALDVGVPLLCSDGIDNLLVQVDKLDREACSQVFAIDHIRDLSEQRVWMETNRSVKKKKATKVGKQYRITQDGKKVRFTCDQPELTRQQLISILAEMS